MRQVTQKRAENGAPEPARGIWKSLRRKRDSLGSTMSSSLPQVATGVLQGASSTYESAALAIALLSTELAEARDQSTIMQDLVGDDPLAVL